MLTQIILPSNINNTIISNSITFASNVLSTNDVSGSNCSGKYLYNTIDNNNNLILTGSGGGNLLGLPCVILINFTGKYYVNINQQTIGIIVFTILIQITISGNTGTLSFNQSYARLTDQTGITVNTQNITIELSNTPCISVIYANNTRYLNIGCFTIKFTIQ